MWTSWLNNCLHCCHLFEYNKCETFWHSCHWISLHNVVLDRTEFLKIIVYVLLSCTTYSSYKYFPLFHLFWWILLPGWTIWLRLWCSSVIWHLLLTCVRQLTTCTHSSLAVGIIGLAIRISICSIALLVVTLLIGRLLGLGITILLSICCLCLSILLLAIILGLPLTLPIRIASCLLPTLVRALSK